ncbi:hypothetical protein KR067_006771 [Drosophila pandora]|nr:hypothetical protein KR067_006771 [Drosophila pandora]
MAPREICRVCSNKMGTEDETYNLLEMPDLAEKFSDCTNLVVDPMEHEMMPSEICCDCYEQIEKFHAFRALCILTDHRWRSKTWLFSKDIGLDKPVLDVDELTKEAASEPFLTTPVMMMCVDELASQRPSLQAEEITKSVPKDNVSDPVDAGEVSSYKCDICFEEFSDEKRFSTHKREHDGHSLYHCTEPGCEESFNRYESLRQHELEHAEVGMRFVCDQEGCKKMYRHKGSLKTHLSKAHQIGKPLKTHVCEYCGKMFQNQAGLTHHRFTHRANLQLPFPCEVPGCSLRFQTKQKLEVHMLRHNGIKNFSCPYCGLRKTTKNELRLHINFHTLERTWSCSQCPKVCNSSTSLKKHFRTIHEKARDYACSHCEKSFATADTRKYHEMTHTGEKNFECHECGRRFTQPAALRTHRKIHEREEPKQLPTFTIATFFQEFTVN